MIYGNITNNLFDNFEDYFYNIVFSNIMTFSSILGFFWGF